MSRSLCRSYRQEGRVYAQAREVEGIARRAEHRAQHVGHRRGQRLALRMTRYSSVGTADADRPGCYTLLLALTRSPDFFVLLSSPWPLSVSSGTRRPSLCRVWDLTSLRRKPISLISHSDVRYRGILAGIDPVASTIQLSNGTCSNVHVLVAMLTGTLNSVLYGNGVAKVRFASCRTCRWDEAITDVKELRLTCPRAHKPRVDSSVAFLLILSSDPNTTSARRS